MVRTSPMAGAVSNFQERKKPRNHGQTINIPSYNSLISNLIMKDKMHTIIKSIIKTLLDKKMGTSLLRASLNASSPHGYQFTFKRSKIKLRKGHLQ